MEGFSHIPVLLEQTINGLDVKKNGRNINIIADIALNIIKELKAK